MIKPVFVLSFSLLAVAAQAQMSPLGLWRTIDDDTNQPKAEVRISQNAAGVLSGVLEKSLLTKPGTEPNCNLCSDDRKDKPKIGLEIIRGGQASEGKLVWEGGKVLDPENGKNYSLRLTPIDGGKKLEVRAFIGAPLLGRTQTWIRIQ